MCFEKLENIRKLVCNVPEMTMDSKITKEWVFENAVVIVAHPDDETLWAGGTILMHPETHWTILTLCRTSDPDR